MKKSIIPVAAFIAGMAIVPSVFAAETGGSTAIKSLGDLAKCVADGKAICTYAGDDDLVFDQGGDSNGAAIVVNKNVTIDLGGKKAVIKAEDEKVAFQVAKGATLTLTHGYVESEHTTNPAISVEGGLVLNADVQAAKPIDVKEGFEKVVVNSAVTATSTNSALAVAGNDNFFGTKAGIVEINGSLAANKLEKGGYVYTQTGNVNATIKGGISTTTGRGISFAGGVLNLAAGSSVNASNAAILVLGGNVSKNININCATVTSTNSAALYIDSNAVIEALSIKNSTLTSTNKSTINGGEKSKINTVTINGSHLVAKSDAYVKIGDTEFGTTTYDGRELAKDENVLTEAVGSYGTLAACDAAAEEPGEDKKGEETENPNTADTIATYLTIATVALLGLGATAFVAKKSNR